LEYTIQRFLRSGAEEGASLAQADAVTEELETT